MYRDRDFDLENELPWNKHALIQDLELDTLLRSMAGDDEFLFDVARKALLSSLHNNIDTVLYRQAILKDCLKNPTVVRNLYALAVDIVGERKNRWLGVFSRRPTSILDDAIRRMELLVDGLKKLRDMAKAQADLFESEGFLTLFSLLEKELSDEYLTSVRDHLKQLDFPKGALLSAEMGERNEGTNYILRQAHRKEPNWFLSMLGYGQPGYSFKLDPQDEVGARILSEMEDTGINLVANALAQSADHIQSFFTTLRSELAFYIGCLNLHEQLTVGGRPVCFPRPAPVGERKLHFTELHDVCLSLLMSNRRVVGNTVNADGKSLVVITGANQGGKSVFLRSIGLAQMMMQCGMFVVAESFNAEMCMDLFTHYKREEDKTMNSGKFDEELARMSQIVDHLAQDSMILFNESFAATNDCEGSEIDKQIISALLDSHIKVLFVTHLYEFAHGLSSKEAEDMIFLRAERSADGTRPFKLLEGKPLETSYGEDLYREMFSVGIEDRDE
jgi:ABC-type histidine transport system ATPase subunit